MEKDTNETEPLQGQQELNEQPEQEEQLPMLNLPDSVFREDVKKMVQDDTIQDSKEYIGIILSELEETKSELAKARIPAPEKKNIWKGISVVLLLVLACWVLIFFYTKDRQDEDGTAEPTAAVGAPEDTGNDTAETEKERYIVDLQTYVDQIKQSDTAPFSASVESMYGYEYLVFTYENISIFYQNEYMEGEEDNKRVMIDNGTQLSEFNWDYDLTGDLKDLIPYYGTYLGNDSYQLLFLQYSEEMPDYPEEIHFIDVSNLYNYNTINMKEELLKLFLLDYAEAPSTEDAADSVTTMIMTVGEAVYTYYISTDDYVDAVYYSANNLSVDQYFTMEFSDAGITFNTAVTLSDDEFLGEVSGVFTVNGIYAGLTNVKYGAYVDADQEDYGSDGVITPRKSYLYDKITISGSNNERYLIALSDEIGYNDINWDNWIEEDGFFTYYVDNVPATICGIDVSRYQGEIDWEKVKNAGAEFAMIRLGYRGTGEGTLEIDKYFLQNIEAANEAGIHVGIYFYSQAINETEAVEEANFVLRNISGFAVDYPIVFDTEMYTASEARANNLTREERTNLCIAFCDRIKEAGYTPMIYSNTRYMIMGIDLERLTSYDKWFAYYGENYTFPYDFQMYQYSAQGIIDGIDGYVDLDVSFIDYAADQESSN